MPWLIIFLAAGLLAALAIGYVIARRRSTVPKSADAPIELRQLETVVETMQLGVTVTDLDGRIVYVNPADAAMHGYTREELLGRDGRVYAPTSRSDPLTADEIDRMKRWRRESVNVRRDGSEFPVNLMSDVVRDADGEPVGIVTTCEDITVRKEAEEAVRKSEERYALAMRGAEDGLWDWNLEAGEVFYSPHWKAMLGYADDEIGDSPDEWLDRVHPDDLAGFEAELQAHLEGRVSRFQCEHRILHADGDYRWVVARAVAERDDERGPYRIAGALTDITERKNVEEQLEQEALYDALTGLPNRVLLTDLLQRSFSRLERRDDYRFGLLFMDLDDFKAVNDSLGHTAGDELLVEVGQRFQEALRPGDVVARIGGDEFCILLDEINDASDTTRVAERVQQILQRPVDLGGREIRTSASIGIAVSDADVETPEEMLRVADTAMYRAKSSGRGRFEIYDREMHERAVSLLEMEEELQDALSEGQLRLVYQPVVTLESGGLAGLKALLRWIHPRHGETPPDRFIPVAEETGMMVPVGWWVLEEAIRRMSEWVERYPRLADLTMSVNLSARQLRQPNLPERISGLLSEADLPPQNLRLEIGERSLMDHAERNAATVGRLRDLGVHVQVDDFGTGTSSLSYLRRFPVSTLKIDGAFIQNMDSGSEPAALVEAVISLARSLGIQVVAEGVETQEQSRRLRTLRCEQGQGFLYSRPVEQDAVIGILEAEAKRRNGHGP